MFKAACTYHDYFKMDVSREICRKAELGTAVTVFLKIFSKLFQLKDDFFKNF